MNRLKLLYVVILLVAITILIRLFYWQFISDVEKRTTSDINPDEIPAPRGEILSSDNYPLATNQEAYLVYALPKAVENPKDMAEKIAPFLIPEKFATVSVQENSELSDEKQKAIAKEKQNILKKINNNDLFWVLLSRKIPKDIKDKISSLSFKGVGFERDDKRFYPEASMAAQLLGFVGSDRFGNDTGYFGLEGYYNPVLKGKPGRGSSTLDPKGFPILTGKFNTTPPQKGTTLVTTIDRAIQFIVEQKLEQAVSKYGAKDGTIIIMEPKTGHILAMATYPSYNPAFFQEYGASLYRNPAVADNYEPGSTFKVVTMSSALDLNLVTPTTKCNVCDGPRQIGGYEISTWNKKYYPNSTMADVITHSDNVGMTFVSQKLGLNQLYSYITKFGFGKLTGIDLEEESPGVIHNKEDWHEIDIATASFGQGLTVTPIQIIQAVGAIANGGNLIKPKLVDATISNGQMEKSQQSEGMQVISKKAATQMTEMMVGAVDNGEAKAFKPKGYRIAGKTGTAQVPVAGHYDANKTIASFVGFAPAQNPKFVMLVRFTEPTSSQFGSETAAPTFFSIAKELFNYYGIPADK
jgi:cell division protein FtsI/penicillin-binding protein 2